MKSTKFLSDGRRRCLGTVVVAESNVPSLPACRAASAVVGVTCATGDELVVR